MVASVRAQTPDLSARQMALLLCVYLTEGPHTVRGLALTLGVSKPAISRALDRLGELGYVRRKRDDIDRRNVMVQRTADGALFLMDFSAMLHSAQQHLLHAPPIPALGDFDMPEAGDGFVPLKPAHAEAGWIDAAE